MTIKNDGQAIVSFTIFTLPLCFLFLLVVTALYYFSYLVASQYHSYQAMLCVLNAPEKICSQKFIDKLKYFRAIKVQEIKFEYNESRKAEKVSIHWQDYGALVNQVIKRENSVYIPKKI